MNIESRLDGGILVATLKGRMDAVKAPEFDACFGTRTQASFTIVATSEEALIAMG